MNIEKIIMDSTMNKSLQEVLKYMNDNKIYIPINLQFKLLILNSLPYIISETNTLEISFGVFFLQILKQSQNQNIRNQFSNSVNYFQQLKDVNQQTYIQICRILFKKTSLNLNSLILDFKTVDDQIQESFIAEINMFGKQPQIYHSAKYNNQETLKYRIFLYENNGGKLHIIFSTNNQPQPTPQQQLNWSQNLNIQQPFNLKQPFTVYRFDSFPIQKSNNDHNIIRTTQLNNAQIQHQFQFNKNNFQFPNQQVNISNQQQNNFTTNNLQNNGNQNNLNINSCKSIPINQQNNQYDNTLTDNNKPYYQFKNPAFIQQNNNTQQQQSNMQKEPQNIQLNNNNKEEVNELFRTEQIIPGQSSNIDVKVQPTYGRLSTKCINNENSQQCHICCSFYNQNSDEAIMTPCCNKIVHRECMQMDLNEKAKQSLSFEKINCFDCNISLKNYKDFLKLNIPRSIFLEIIKTEVLANIALKCCKCLLPIQISQDNKQLQVECLNCHTMLCRLCCQSYHGENETNQQCPSLLIEIQKAISGMPILVCPFCNLLQTKDDHCNHVKCSGCKRDLCSACSVDREPILIHGNHYHREGCPDYRPFIKDGKQPTIPIPDFDRRNCKICKETNKACQFPISLEEYRKQKQF